MKSKLITLTILLAFLTTGFVFAQYYSGKTFGQKDAGKIEVSAEKQELKSTEKQDTSPNCETQQDKFQQASCRLKSFREKGTLDELMAERNKIEEDWAKSGGDSYGNLSLEFLGVLTSARFQSADDKALKLSQDRAIQSLKKADTFDLEIEWQLLNYLRYSSDEVELNKSQIEERRERVKLWLHALHRLEAEKDKNFNPDDLPQLNAPLPAGVNGISGMAPEEIKEPQLRRQYEEAIRANAKKRQYYNQQYRLRQNEEFIVKHAAKYISKVYSQPPNDPGELETLFKEYKISDNLKKIITDQINPPLRKNS